MPDRIWKPNATVAALIAHQERYLLVEEETDDGLRFNQPAGHLDQGETLLAACVRETFEETGYRVTPTALVGIYQWSPPDKGDLTYHRFAFATTLDADQSQPAGLSVHSSALAAGAAPGVTYAALDAGIARAIWLDYDAVLACRDRHRSPLVLQCIDDYRAGRRFPLDLIRHHD
jgi:ADP-ribose pyrophosphatase YjhB (NUDIX family)